MRLSCCSKSWRARHMPTVVVTQPSNVQRHRRRGLDADVRRDLESDLGDVQSRLARLESQR